MDYIDFALSPACQPILADSEDSLDLDTSVLDPRCITDSDFLPCIDSFLSHHQLSPEESALISPLTSLATGTYVLSLSGGVDSMCLLVLLRKLNVQFIAVHIRHSSRIEDTQKELDWVRYVCKRLGVPLYYHHVLVARPHGDDKGEITRDQFEEYTRRIRFSMYRKAALLAWPKVSEIFVLIGHHLDDVDENRIAELGKGNLIDIDGMTEEGEISGESLSCISQLRPFCRDVRKFQLREFAINHGVPHMKNSTPQWSKRGWIRDVLDQDEVAREIFVDKLDAMGRMSRNADDAVNAVCNSWTSCCPIGCREISGNTKTKNFRFVKCVSVDLQSLVERVNDEVVPVVTAMTELVRDFAPSWNNACKNMKETRGVSDCPIQEIGTGSTDLLVVCLTRALQVCFKDLRDLLGVDKFIPRKSAAQLVDLVNSGRNCVTWKINRIDVHMIRVSECWYVLNTGELDTVLKSVFGGSMEAFRKCILSNPDKIRLVSN